MCSPGRLLAGILGNCRWNCQLFPSRLPRYAAGAVDEHRCIGDQLCDAASSAGCLRSLGSDAIGHVWADRVCRGDLRARPAWPEHKARLSVGATAGSGASALRRRTTIAGIRASIWDANSPHRQVEVRTRCRWCLRDHRWCRAGMVDLSRSPARAMPRASRVQNAIRFTSTFQAANRDGFVNWFKTKLLSKLRCCDVIVIDNLDARRDPRILRPARPAAFAFSTCRRTRRTSTRSNRETLQKQYVRRFALCEANTLRRAARRARHRVTKAARLPTLATATPMPSQSSPGRAALDRARYILGRQRGASPRTCRSHARPACCHRAVDLAEETCARGTMRAEAQCAQVTVRRKAQQIDQSPRVIDVIAGSEHAISMLRETSVRLQAQMNSHRHIRWAGHDVLVRSTSGSSLPIPRGSFADRDLCAIRFCDLQFREAG